MLNIRRRKGERIVVGEDIFVSVLEVNGQTVRLGVDAPRSVSVYREELWLEIKAENEAAVRGAGDELPPGEIPTLPEVGAPGDDAAAGPGSESAPDGSVDPAGGPGPDATGD